MGHLTRMTRLRRHEVKRDILRCIQPTYIMFLDETVSYIRHIKKNLLLKRKPCFIFACVCVYCVYLSVCKQHECMHAHECGVHRNQKRTSDPLELKEHAIVSSQEWVVGSKPRTSSRAV